MPLAAAAVLGAVAVLFWPPTRPRFTAASSRSADTAWGWPGPVSRRVAQVLGPVGRVAQTLTGRAEAMPATAEVADTLVLIALAVRSGMGLAEALAQVQTGSAGAVKRDLGAVVAALRWGRSAAQAWAFAGPCWRPVALAWQVADQTGAPPADLVERAAHRLRATEGRAAERRAARAGVLLVVPLGLGFLPAFACTAVVPVVVALAHGVLGG
ncbi:type II secretion system F family protein [Nostocoides sp. HKS02]|uniref:type II secretion system F family protein n=1 Tax=Nostocoides sp. HKS02 TaxID=1813880 RepID=UPI0012B44E2A|nr:type II secretion system F family protein [Tetrasphaera sp. HKS02]QGN58423.1 hypothetical protein GKE56_11615 [Tetrasphaera sp. HKS02]